MSILDEIKAIAKDGADLSRIETALNDLDPLKNIKTKADALAFMKRNEVFSDALKSEVDSETSTRINKHDENFMKEKLPKIIEEKQKEWEKKPKREPWEEEMEKLKAEREADKAELARERLRREIEVKAKDLKYTIDPDRYVAYGEKAIEYLEADAKTFEETVETRIKTFAQEKFGKQGLDKMNEQKDIKKISRSDFDSYDPGQKAEYVKSGGIVTD